MSEHSDYAPSVRYAGALFARSDMNLAASTSVIEGLPDEQRTSPVRRTYLLVMVFDLLLTFILWIIYAQQTVLAGGIREALRQEVLEYTFQTSLFDIVLLAAFRFTVVEVAYGLFTIRTPWWSAVVTGVTSTVLVTKCFLFNFHQHNNDTIGLAYVVIISAVILTWVETSFLIYRVIPMEKAARRVAVCMDYDEQQDELRSLLGNRLGNTNRHGAMSTYTGYFTPRGGSIFGDDIYRPPKTVESNREAAVDVAALLSRANQLYSELWYLYKLDAWGPETVDKGNNGGYAISSTYLPGYGPKVYRIETFIDASPETLFREMVHNFTDAVMWNKNINSIERIQSIPSENADVIYSSIREVLGGLISRRDFVLLRSWGQHEGVHFLGSTSVDHPMYPPVNGCVRAHQLINAHLFEPVADDPNQCKFVWIMCNDLKIYLPQRLLDNGIHSTIPTMLTALKDKFSRQNSPTPQTDGVCQTPSQLPLVQEAFDSPNTISFN